MKKKKGISLIVLIITIIVVIILAVTVILTITKNNPIESAKEAVFKEDVRAFQDELNMYISNEYTRLQGQRDIKITAKGYGKDGDKDKDSVYTYIPDFKKKYEGKLAIKDDMIVYVGSDAKEKEWLLNSGVYMAKTLTVKYVDQDGNRLKEDESITLMDNYYSVDVPEIEGYIRFSEKLEGKISQDIEVIAEYYLENDNLAFMGLNASGKETTDEASIVSYEVTGIGECNVSKIAIPREHNGKTVIKIKEKAFNGNTTLVSVIIGNNVNIVEKAALANIFSLKAVSIDASKIETLAFSGCSYLEKVIIKKNVNYIGYQAFLGCNKLNNVTILSEMLEELGDLSLFKSKNLKEIKVNSDNSKYTVSDGVLFSKDEKKIYAYPSGKDENTYAIPKSVTTLCKYSFSQSVNLESIDITNNIENVENNVFISCERLKRVKINANEIGRLVFANSINLEEVLIGNNVYSWLDGIYMNCSKLKSITYLGTMNEWNNTLGKTSLWKNGNKSITKVICSDGEINL